MAAQSRGQVEVDVLRYGSYFSEEAVGVPFEVSVRGNHVDAHVSLTFVPSLLLLVTMAAPVTLANAQTKMFKCMIDGHTVYQQTACPVTQQASEAASAPQTASTPASAPSFRSTKREKAAARSAMFASAP